MLKKKQKKAATKKKVVAVSVFKPTEKKRDYKPKLTPGAKLIEIRVKKRKEPIKKKQSKYWLTNRTKLTAEQMDRAKAESAGGQDQKFVEQKDGSFKQSLPLTQALRKAYDKAQKWVLYSDEHKHNIYIAQDKQAGITLDLEQARLFADGFDNPEFKATYYGGLFNLKLKFHRITIKQSKPQLTQQQKETKPDSQEQSDGQFMHDQQQMMHNPNDDL